MAIQEKIKQYYDIFRKLPATKSIVRDNQVNDAFEILVYDLLFRKEKYSEELTIDNLQELEKCIVPPPDGTIDIFYEEDDGDDFKYHIVQVKNSDLAEAEIKTCFANMRLAIDTFIKKPKDVTENLRQVISETNFDEDYKSDCVYYVVHSGEKDTYRGQKENEKIITVTELETIFKSVVNLCVPNDKIKTDNPGNFIIYENTSEENSESYRAYQVNLNAYDLAVLCNKYINTEIGKNILFGQNIREALTKGSKTFTGMCKSIDTEPTNFWYYNNGITIIAEEVDLKKIEGAEYLELKNFSIINGAQTTSTFGKYLKDAKRDGEQWKKENLKMVFVAARIVETKENLTLKKKIAVFNNTQNPISSRDMVSNNDEQKLIQKKFQTGDEPNIFIQIRRGDLKPKAKVFEKHQTISNDELAQLVFASYLSSPFTAKDKKNSLFNRDNTSTDFEINKEYHQVFNFSEDPLKQGELFKRSKDEINELLFIKFLHNKAKKHLKDGYNKRIDQNQQILDNSNSDEANKKSATRTLELLKKLKQINNINTFYNITLYYEFKRQFDSILNAETKKFDYAKFYDRDKTYETELVKAFSDFITTVTIDIIKELGLSDPAKFVRAKNSQDQFLNKLSEKLTINTELQDKYADFITKYKI